MSGEDRRLNEIVTNWRSLAGSTIGVSGGIAALVYYSYSVITAELAIRYGWSRGETGAAHMSYAFALAAASPLVGAFMDRHGAFRMIAFCIVAEAVVLLALAVAPAHFAMFLTLQILLAVAGAATTPLGYNRIVAEKFDKLRGLAFACIMCGNGLCAMIVPIFTSHIISLYGWRGAYVALAAIAAFVGGGGLALAYSGRHSPTPASTATDAGADQSPQPIGTILRQRIFWHLLAAFLIATLGCSGYVPNLVRMLAEMGISRSAAAGILGLMGFSVLSGRFITGLLIDRIFAHWVAAGCVLLTLLGILALAIGGIGYAVPAAFVIGFTVGAEIDILPYLGSRYFGVCSLGRTYGILYAGIVIASGISPALIGLIADHFGSYVPALWGSVGLLAVSIVLLVTLPRYPQASAKAESLPA